MAIVILGYHTEEESRRSLSIWPKCGRQVRIDGHCECEAIFFAPIKRDKKGEICLTS